MAKTATATADTSKSCACGCGKPVTRLFLQGHDQRLVSNLASDLVYADVWGGKCMGILKGALVRGDQQVKIDTVTQYVREKISDALASKVYNAAMRQWDLQKTQGERAAKKAEKTAATKKAAPKRASKAAPSEEAGAAKEPKVITKAAASAADVDAEEARIEAEGGESRHATGDGIRVLIGKRKRNAVVRGMNQSGKVTAIAIVTNGKETVIDDPERFTVLSN